MAGHTSDRISIHAGNQDDEFALHPCWRGANDEELTASPFCSAREEAELEMREVNELLEDVLEKAPSDAAAEILVDRRSGGFDVQLNIHSSQGVFGRGQGGSTFRKVVEDLLTEMRSEIEEWKRHRRLNTDSE